MENGREWSLEKYQDHNDSLETAADRAMRENREAKERAVRDLRLARQRIACARSVDQLRREVAEIATITEWLLAQVKS